MNRLSQCRPLLGTYVKISVWGDGSDDELLEQSLGAFDEIERIQRSMSFHDPESELSHLNRTAHCETVSISPEMETVLGLGLRLSQQTDGRFDLSIGGDLVRLGALPDHGDMPGSRASWREIELDGGQLRFHQPLRLDLGGIAKGYAVDRALARIAPELSAVVNAGGDLSQRPWQGESVEVRIPPSPGAPRPRMSLLELPMTDASVASSSGYFSTSGHHPIVEPKSGVSLQDHRSVSVFASSCMVADALTKVVFLVEDCEPILDSFQARAAVLDAGALVTYLGRSPWPE